MYRVTLALKDVDCPHGWRSSLTTLARDIQISSDIVHTATNHAHGTETAMRYDRGDRFERRITMINWWGEQLVAAGAAAQPTR